MRFIMYSSIAPLLAIHLAGCPRSTSSGDGDVGADTDIDADDDSDGGADGDVDLPHDPCTGVDCSGHGICLSEGGQAVCVCDPGYQASGLNCFPVSVDGDADTDDDADPDIDEETEDVCDWRCDVTDPDMPQLRMTTLEITEPVPLSSLMIAAILADSIDGFRLIWLLEIDLEEGTVTSGAGVADRVPPETDEEFCLLRWNEDFPPDTTDIVFLGEEWSTVEAIPQIRIPVYSDDSMPPDPPLLVLPLSNVTVSRAGLSRPCMTIGAEGEPGGELAGWISWGDAREVRIEELGANLCDLLCGAPCAMTAPEDCPNPSPDSRGFFLSADFGARPTTIVE
jgi:hypothetical protein